MKNSFDDPFFTDPDYMEKSMRRGLWFAIGYSLLLSLVFGGFVMLIGNQIQQQGGLGHSIGSFIKDIKESAK